MTNKPTGLHQQLTLQAPPCGKLGLITTAQTHAAGEGLWAATWGQQAAETPLNQPRLSHNPHKLHSPPAPPQIRRRPDAP